MCPIPALNIAGNDYEVAKIDLAYAAAEAAGFKLFYSFDMGYSWDAATIATIVAKHASSASTYRWNNQVLVSTFAGESYGNAFWASVKTNLAAKGITISLAPAFTSYRDPAQANTLLSNFPSIDGFFNWWSWYVYFCVYLRLPCAHAALSRPADTNTLLTTDTDLAYQKAVKTRTGPYIMCAFFSVAFLCHSPCLPRCYSLIEIAVSPWQFKELGGGNNWVEQSDTLWKYRWEQAINTVKPDIVEIVTWNDYGERSELAHSFLSFHIL